MIVNPTVGKQGPAVFGNSPRSAPGVKVRYGRPLGLHRRNRIEAEGGRQAEGRDLVGQPAVVRAVRQLLLARNRPVDIDVRRAFDLFEAGVMIDPDDPDRQERARVGGVLRPRVHERVPQPVARRVDRDVDDEQRGRDRENAVGEGLNRVIKIVKNRASGFRNLEAFTDLIYLTIGDFDILAHIPSRLRSL